MALASMSAKVYFPEPVGPARIMACGKVPARQHVAQPMNDLRIAMKIGKRH